MEQPGFQPEQLNLVRNQFPTEVGWMVGEYGVCMLSTKVPGYLASPVRFYHSADPTIFLEGPPKPIAVSRFTPEGERAAHFNREVDYTVPNQTPRKVQLARLIEGSFDKNQLEGELIATNLPMIDIFLFLPQPEEDGEVYFQGRIDLHAQKGASLIVERNVFKPHQWVTGKHKLFPGIPDGDLAIAPFGEGNKEKVFGVDRRLEKLSPDILLANSVTCISMVSNPVPIQSSSLFFQPQITQTDQSYWDLNDMFGRGEGYKGGGGLNYGSGAGFGKMTEGKETGRTVPQGKRQTGLQHGLILNIYPMLLGKQITAQELKEISG